MKTFDECVIRTKHNVYIPCRPWPQRFFVSGMNMYRDGVEVRPITLTALFVAVVTNLITMTRWRMLYGLLRLGFLDTPPYAKWCSFSEDFRLDVWNVLSERKRAMANRKQEIEVYLKEHAS